MEDDQNGRRPKWKTNKMKDDQNERRPKWKTTKMEDDQGRNLLEIGFDTGVTRLVLLFFIFVYFS